MPHLEDASDNDLGIIIPDASEVLVLASSQPYAYESHKMVPWSYDVDLKHKVQDLLDTGGINISCFVALPRPR
ncbi:hypothetical protein NL676_023082 [Syzygium grande]|nr:hypothetical protein NL676_023082 [Syzygium grande]